MELRLVCSVSSIGSLFVFRSVESQPTTHTAAAAEANCGRRAVGRQSDDKHQTTERQFEWNLFEGVGLWKQPERLHQVVCRGKRSHVLNFLGNSTGAQREICRIMVMDLCFRPHTRRYLAQLNRKWCHHWEIEFCSITRSGNVLKIWEKQLKTASPPKTPVFGGAERSEYSRYCGKNSA